MRVARQAVIAGLLLAGCVMGPSPLVRDGANLFSARAEAIAEGRLQALGERHGVWVFVISEPNGDPPRMLDEPMTEAEADGLPAVAILLDGSRSIGTGYTDRAADAADMSSFSPPSAIDGMLERGDNDVALEVIVDHVEAWVRAQAGEIGG